MTRNLVVEFCGLPGAGKTTYAGALIAGLGRRHVPAISADTTIGPDVRAALRVSRKLRLVAANTLARPAESGRLAAHMARTANPWTTVASRWVQWAVTQRLIRQSRATDMVHVLGEGVVQALWSVGLRGDARPLLDGLSDGSFSWSAPDLVIVVDVPVELALERLRTRPGRHSRIQSLDPDQQALELARGNRLLENLLVWYGETAPPGHELLRVTNDRPLEDGAGAAVEQIVRRVAAVAHSDGSDGPPPCRSSSHPMHDTTSGPTSFS